MKEENKIGDYEIHEFATDIKRIDGSLEPREGLLSGTFSSFDDDEDEEEEDDDFDDDDFEDDDDDFLEDEEEDEELDDCWRVVFKDFGGRINLKDLNREARRQKRASKHSRNRMN
jgi:hypothetical protein